MRIRICIIKVGSGSVRKDTNPDPDPGQIGKCAEACNNTKKNLFLTFLKFSLNIYISLAPDSYGEFRDPGYGIILLPVGSV